MQSEKAYKPLFQFGWQYEQGIYGRYLFFKTGLVELYYSTIKKAIVSIKKGAFLAAPFSQCLRMIALDGAKKAKNSLGEKTSYSIKKPRFKYEAGHFH